MELSNPIIAGFAPDPSVVYVDGIFYLATSSFHIFPGIPIYASQNLRDWTHIANAIDRREQLSLCNASTVSVPLRTGHHMLASGGLFAPTIRYHQGRFYIVCTNAAIIPSLKVDNFIIWTDDIWSGQWSNPIAIPFPGIDPSLFIEDGRAYIQGSFSLGPGADPSCTIKQFEIDIKTGETVTEARELWSGNSRIDTEAPHIYARDGFYYLVVAEGGTFEYHHLSIARSKDIWGPYESFCGNPILTSDGKPDEYIQNVGHGELFQDGSGQWWAAVLGVRSEDGLWPLGRESFLVTVDWPAGGWPRVSQPARKFTAPDPTAGTITDSARVTFESKCNEVPSTLCLVYIRNPDYGCYKLPIAPLEPLGLHPSQSDFSSPTGTCTFLGRRQRSLTTTAEATIDLSTLQSEDNKILAGLAVYKHHQHHISLQFDAGAHLVRFRGVNQDTSLSEDCPTPFAVKPGTRSLHLKIVASAAGYQGYAAATAEDGSRGVWGDMGFWETAKFVAREMTGPILGVFAHSELDKDAGTEVNFTQFEVLA